ncbi:MAG: hypothetical protein IIC80_02450 [Chloroflexi bacterium]|nr:hypothetical protein [Chloroflexota bacterium]
MRLIALAVTWWSGLSMGAVSAPIWVWAGGPLIATLGHWISWQTRNRKMTVVRWTVVLTVLGLSALMALQLPAAWAGNWLPAAQYLVFVQAIASFDLRTRGGLYTNFLISAMVLFLASQLAFGQEFLLFIAGFFVLLLVFLATTSFKDAVEGTLARASWPPLTKALSWAGWGGAILGIGIGLFLVLPWGTLRASAGADATAAILPFTGEIDRPSSADGPAASADGPASADDQATSADGPSPQPPQGPPSTGDAQPPPAQGETLAAGAPAAGEGAPASATGPIELDLSGEQPSASIAVSVGGTASQASPAGEATDPSGAAVDPTGATVAQAAPSTAAGAAGAEAATGEAPTPTDELAEERNQAVLRVRSPVASYWRGQTFSIFDGEVWAPDGNVALEPSVARGLSGRYTQTYYVVEAQPRPLLAYTPLDWGLVGRTGDGLALEARTVYRGVSQRLPFEANLLRLSVGARSARMSRDPRIPTAVRDLAEEIVADSDNLFDRALAITQYLRDNYRFAPSDEFQAQPVSPEAFLFEGDGAGDNVDFASAAALLARAAGLDARVASGYLPGGFDPLSGAYIVRRSDAHAWAEVRFPGFGWVPFDPSPRQDLPVEVEQSGLSARVVNEIFQWQAGDTIGAAIGSAFDVLTDDLLLTASILLGVTSTALLAWSLAIRRRQSRRLRPPRYTGLAGRERRQIMAAYRSLEATLRARRISPRGPAETFAAYFARVARLAPDLETVLAPVRDAVDAAAYSPASPTREDVATARAQVRRIKPALRRNPPLA